MDSSKEEPNKSALVPSRRQDIEAPQGYSLQNTQPDVELPTILTNIENRLDRTSLKVDLIGRMVYDIGRTVKSIRYFMMGGLIVMIGSTALIVYQIKGIGDSVEGIKEDIEGFERAIHELVYSRQPITITESIAEARRDIEKIRSGYYPSYDLFVLEDIIARSHSNIPTFLIEDAKQLYQRFVEHRQKVATTETPTQYSTELLGLLNQKVSLEQQIAGAIPTGYYFRSR